MKDYKKLAIIWILFLLILKTFDASCIELGNDEVYYSLYAKQLQWNYFDHPPLVGWMIRLFTFNLKMTTEIFIRAGSLIAGSFTLWIIFLTGKKWKDERTGFFAALLFGSTTYSFIISGLFVLPDAPQMLFWSCSLLMLVHFLKDSAKNEYLLYFGIFTGLGMMSKIHTVFLWIGFGGFILFHFRVLLSRWQLYISVLIMLIIFSPVIYWNFREHFITYAYHSNRVNHFTGIHADSFFSFAAGQIVYASPVVIIIWISSVITVLKKKDKDQVHLLLLYTALPLFILLICSSLFNTTLPHWSGPSYISLSLLSAAIFADKPNPSRFMKRIIIWPVIVLTALPLLVNFFPGAITSQHNKPGNGDPSTDMYGWKKSEKILRPFLDSLKKEKSRLIFCSHKWFPAAHIDHYICEPNHIPLLCLGEISDIHQYYFLNRERPQLIQGDTAYCIIPSNYPSDPDITFRNFFNSMKLIRTFVINRNGRPCRILYVYELSGFKNQISPEGGR